jgi:hypothetical protein
LVCGGEVGTMMGDVYQISREIDKQGRCVRWDGMAWDNATLFFKQTINYIIQKHDYTRLLLSNISLIHSVTQKTHLYVEDQKSQLENRTPEITSLLIEL